MRLGFSIVILLFGFSTKSQSIEILDNNQNHHGKIGSKIEVPVKIRNNSDRVIHLMVQRVTSQIGSTQSTFFCWGEECFDQDTHILPTSKKLAPGEESAAFLAVLEAGITEQFSTVTYIFYDRDNPSNAVTYELNYNVEEKESKGLLYESEDITLSDAYPNPVSDKAIIQYRFFDETKDAKILIHNVLGSIVGEYKLLPVENQIKISTLELNPGVYFYTLYLDNKGLVTKKLIVKKE
jgi:hypothetical protein